MRRIEPLLQRLLIARQREILAVEEGIRAEHDRHAGLEIELARQLPSSHHRIGDLRHGMSPMLAAADRDVPDRRY